MDAAEKFSSYAFRVFIFSVFALSVADVRADLSAKNARKAITRMAGFELTNGEVKVKTISNAGVTAAEVTAQIRSVFRFDQDGKGRWRVAEIRTGPNNWESIDSIAHALGTSRDLQECNSSEPPARAAAIEPTVKRARCLLGNLFGIQVPSDAVRIQEVAPFAIPLASQPSTIVVAWIQVEARLMNESGGWKVTELRTGNRDWIKVEPLLSALNQEKREIAHAELTTIAQALERFRSERGSYLISDKQAAAIDHLSPRYLARVIRVDPWKQPYAYQGQRDRFTLSSSGPDRKEATADDIIVTGPVR
ncbi:MAG TPA: type II secretion system protein GspG [Pyrinomonadaceae bacterium]|nr:type II secretion system protein GspG [Pyrinomonadaceae bacterium]